MCNFNDLVSQDENGGDNKHLESLIKGFQEVIFDCDLKEVGISR